MFNYERCNNKLTNFFKRVENAGIVPIIPFYTEEEVLDACKATKDAGLFFVELLQRNENSEKALKLAVKEFPDMTIGAGTVLNIEQCKRVLDKGAKFIVSPGFDEKLVKYCLIEKVIVIPGAVTPTEVQMSVNCGLSILKFFPFFQMGGIKMLEMLKGPYPTVKYIVSGVGFEHLREIMQCDRILAASGVWMFGKEDGTQKKESMDMVKILEDSIRLVENIRK